MPEPSWDFFDDSAAPPRRRRGSQRKRQPRLLLWVTTGMLAIAAVVLWGIWATKQNPSLEILPIADMEIGSRGTLRCTVAVRTTVPRSEVRFFLQHGPRGAQIDAQTGRFVWKATEQQTPTKYNVTVRVAAGDLSAQREFRITVLPRGDRPEGLAVKNAGASEAYAAQDANNRPGGFADNTTENGKAATNATPSPPVAQTPPRGDDTAARKAQQDAGDQTLLDLYRKHAILAKTSHPAIRHVFADRFEADHEDAIRTAFGEKPGDFRKWLDARPNVKEEFFLALDPEYDDIPRALGLFRKLYDRYPEKFEEYANLAIAVSVVWDREDGSIHGSPIENAVAPAHSCDFDGMDNFHYYAESPPALAAQMRCLPWEFLVFVVNHRTTLPDRRWTQQEYLPKRAMIGNCFGDVPYDGDMLKGEPARMEGKLYVFPNLRNYGGVCRHQADYATRVAKSIGVPAFTAGAANNLGEGHAWVMWTELGPLTRTGFEFSLQSAGRYQSQKYYVGGLTDPHTGMPTTDREVELRLHTVACDPLLKRQGDLLMRAYPMLREKLALDRAEQLKFLSQVVKHFPGNEAVWKTLAKMSREGQITKANHELMRRIVNGMFLAFASFPDFTWVVFDDMVHFEDRAERKADLYARLAGMYEQAGRVDLSCKARLKHAELLVSCGRTRDAAASLAAGILLFPDEGRYVPLLLDKLEAVCRNDKAGQRQMVLFYQQFLPKVPQPDGKNLYGVAMFKRAAEFFREAGEEQLATACEMKSKWMAEKDAEKRKDGRSLQDVLTK